MTSNLRTSGSTARVRSSSNTLTRLRLSCFPAGLSNQVWSSLACFFAKATPLQLWSELRLCLVAEGWLNHKALFSDQMLQQVRPPILARSPSAK